MTFEEKAQLMPSFIEKIDFCFPSAAAWLSVLLFSACSHALPLSSSPRFTERVRHDPEGVDVYDQKNNWLAHFTRGAVTVILQGPQRIFTEPTAAAAVKHELWVRTLDQAFTGAVDDAWLAAALQANERREEDILAIAMEYIKGAPPRFDAAGRQIAGDASYGPLKTSGQRAKGSDVEDYLAFPALKNVNKNVKNRAPEAQRWKSLDCSGFIRMVWGFRAEQARQRLVASRDKQRISAPSALASELARTAAGMYAADLGLVIIADKGSPPADLKSLEVGDILFFDAASDPQHTIDHVALYLGQDEQKHYRFLSSRPSADGPTMGDEKGASILDGDGHFARGFRAAKRF